MNQKTERDTYDIHDNLSVNTMSNIFFIKL